MTTFNKVWVTGIATDEGLLSRYGFKYPAGIKDVFNGDLLGYAIEHMTGALVTQTHAVL